MIGQDNHDPFKSDTEPTPTIDADNGGKAQEILSKVNAFISKISPMHLGILLILILLYQNDLIGDNADRRAEGNDLTVQQNTLLEKQNELIANQNSYLRKQVDFLEADLQAKEEIDLQRRRLKLLSVMYDVAPCKSKKPERYCQMISGLRTRRQAFLEYLELVREEEPDKRIILDGIRLPNVELEGIDLSNVSLFDADFSGSNLDKANLKKADLSEANLSDTHLIDAELQDAILMSADLRGAYLIKANLDEANVAGANLSGTRLNETSLLGTILRDGSLVVKHDRKTSWLQAQYNNFTKFPLGFRPSESGLENVHR